VTESSFSSVLIIISNAFKLHVTMWSWIWQLAAVS